MRTKFEKCGTLIVKKTYLGDKLLKCLEDNGFIMINNDSYDCDQELIICANVESEGGEKHDRPLW